MEDLHADMNVVGPTSEDCASDASSCLGPFLCAPLSLLFENHLTL